MRVGREDDKIQRKDDPNTSGKDPQSHEQFDTKEVNEYSLIMTRSCGVIIRRGPGENHRC